MFQVQKNFLGIALPFTKKIPLETYLSEIGGFSQKLHPWQTQFHQQVLIW